MHELFAALLRQPTAKRYQRLRTQLLADRSLGEFSLRLTQLQNHLDAQFNNPESRGEQLGEASALLGYLMPAGLVSLRLHRLGGMLALEQQQAERAELHRFSYDAVTKAILATGNGTRRRPLLVTYSSDSVELLNAQGFTVQSQSLVEDNGRRFDVLLCADEREFWFDVTDLLPQTAVVAQRTRRPRRGAGVKPQRQAVVSRS
jgi:hypothetical protein